MKKEYKIAVAGTGYVGLSIATLVYRSLYPGIFPLFISIFLITLPKRTFLSRKFKMGEMIRV